METPIHIPLIRHGQPYESLDKRELFVPQTGEMIAQMSLANPGLIRMDAKKDRAAAAAFRKIPTEEALSILREAGDRFLTDSLEFGPGGQDQSFADYLSLLSTTTGLPHQICQSHAERLKGALEGLPETAQALSHGRSPEALDLHIGDRGAQLAKSVGIVLPSNAPGVNGLWFPLLAFRTPVALKPGHADPWTPLRLISACVRAGIPSEAFSFYPSEHQGGGALLSSKDAGMIFGNDQTTAAYKDNPHVQRNGAGYSKVIFGADTSPTALDHLPILEESVLYNSGRSCINASTISVTAGAEELARRLAARVADIAPMPLEDPSARLAGFPDPTVAAALDDALREALDIPGAVDCTAALRGSGPRVLAHGLNFLLPTVVYCEDPTHPLAQTERPFPLVSVVELPEDAVEAWMKDSLVVTAITESPSLLRGLRESPRIASLREGTAPTTLGDWRTPHIGNLFDLLHVPDASTDA